MTEKLKTSNTGQTWFGACVDYLYTGSVLYIFIYDITD